MGLAVVLSNFFRSLSTLPGESSKDSGIGDWHYRYYGKFPTVAAFLEKGLRFWPAAFQPLENIRAFNSMSLEHRRINQRVVGLLCTS
jgi:hypothetical protein